MHMQMQVLNIMLTYTYYYKIRNLYVVYFGRELFDFIVISHLLLGFSRVKSTTTRKNVL